MKSRVAAVTVSRWILGAESGGSRRESRTAKTWALGRELLLRWSDDDETEPFSNTIIVRARWENDLFLYDISFTLDGARRITDLGRVLRDRVREKQTRRLRSMKASMGREILAKCSFNDQDACDTGEDARAFDAARRALEQCFPDHAAEYIERLVVAGGIR